MKSLTGHFTSKRLTYAPPAGALLDDIRRSYGDDVYPGAR
jgi:allantoin racemase